MFTRLLEWLRRWGPVILIYAGISFLSHQPRLPGPESFTLQFIWFKTAHIIVYATLAFFTFRAVRGMFPPEENSLKKSVILTLLVLLVLSIGDEYHQSFIPGRGPHVRDVIIDMIGSSFGIYGYTRLWRRHKE